MDDDPRLQSFLASALFVVPWFAWQAWVLGTSFRQRRGKLVADANAFAQTRVAQAARRAGGEMILDETETPPLSDAVPGRSRPLLLVLGMGLLFLFARAWLARVLAVVPSAYLDEIFHIPQAQTYCAGRYREWDNKITTPPGLYVVSLLLRPLWTGDNDDALGCSVWALRGANNVAIMLIAIVACSCRAAIERQAQRRVQARRGGGLPLSSPPPNKESIFSLYALHTALNIALLPVLFFFSALYYTDVYATLSALLCYRWFLFRQQHDDHRPPPQWTGLVTILLGLAALLFRQTNIFWVAIYLGGLEAVQAVKGLRRGGTAQVPPPPPPPLTTHPLRLIQHYARQYARGAVHDPPVGAAWPDDGVVCLVSLAVAVVCHPVAVLLRVWPYAALVGSFAAFGAWNGGVVLGDKDNHVATVHLAQLLYMWPLFAFFSAPLVAARVVRAVRAVRTVVFKETKDNRAAAAVQAPLLLRFVVHKTYYPLFLLAMGGLITAVVHRNTIVHPFTLADNRHYMFYVFRYTIRREAVRYALVPVYGVCAWACWGLLGGGDDPDNRDFVNSPFAVAVEKTSSKNEGAAVAATAAATTAATPTDSAPIFLSFLDEDADGAASAAQAGAATSTALLWLMATALTLSMAPLVEPRYFLLPWVYWRLLVPATAVAGVPRAADQGVLHRLARKIDLRLPLETAWSVAVNAATMYVFLYRPYVWRDEQGHVLDDGRLQRFMW